MPQKVLWHVFFILLHVALVHGGCSFPDYTIFGHKWETMISQERHTIGAYWIFNQTAAEFVSLTKLQSSDVYSCVQELYNSFLVRLNPKDTKNEQSLNGNENNDEQTMLYRCIQLFKRSDNVLQLTLSPLSALGPIELLCNGSHTLWDSYILVWPKMTNYEAFPIVGGFQFSMTDPYDNKLCAKLYLPPVLESRCVEEESMNIDFRNFNCRGDLGMQLNQKLVCLGTWIDENFMFSVASSTDETWLRLWLLRFPIDIGQDNFSLDILSEIKDITTENIEPSVDHYTMHLSRKVFASTCEDEANTCNNCNNSNILGYCQKACNACHTNQMENCSNNATGNWIQFSSNGIVNVTISASSMQIGDNAFSCVNLEVNKWYKTKDRKVMTLVFNNGCKPRYICVDFVRRSNSVLQYRLSQYVTWPKTPLMNADDICNEDLFAEEKSKSSNNTPGRHKYKTIITADDMKQKVSCGLVKGYFQLTAHFPDRENCRVIIDSCRNDSQTSFDLVFTGSCNESALTENKHECLAAFTDDTNGDKVMITQDSKTNVAYCWILHKDEWEPRPRFFLTYAADCNADVAKYVLYGNYVGYLAYFDVVAGPGLFGSYSCSQNISQLLNNPANVTLKMFSTVDSPTSQFSLNATTSKPNEEKNNVQAPIRTSNCGNKQHGILINIFMLVVSYNVAKKSWNTL